MVPVKVVFDDMLLIVSIALDPMVRDWLIVQVVPLPETIVTPVGMPGPTRIFPVAIVPVTPETVSVVPEMLPVKLAV